MQRLIIAIVVLLFVFVGDGYSNTLVVDEQGDIFAETDRYQVRLYKGIIIHMHNKLTKETYTRPARTDEKLSGMRGTRESEIEYYLAPEWEIDRADSVKVEKIAPLEAKLTARWNQSTLLMWVVIDVRTGDLIIRQEGFSDQTGISTIGWGVGNLDYDQVSSIVPGRFGEIMNEQHLEHLYWTYPHWWRAPLAIVQGTLGGCFVMSEDETDQFKAWDYRPAPKSNTFGIGFHTHNFFPFEDHQQITSAIWRFNTYRGDWQVPAKRYRQGMMARNESRVAPKPAWVKDIKLVVIYCSMNRNYIRMLDFLAQQINPKNVLIFCRGGWGSGEGVAPDHRVREDLPIFMSAAKQHGFRVMLYTGFQFVSPTHPRYSEWDPCLYRSHRGDILGYEMELGGPAYINPACSSYREYYVQVWKNLQSTYNIDAIHLDVNTFIENHAPLDGLTPIQGNMLLYEELIEAMPGIVFSGEATHALAAPYVAFYAIPPEGNHPINDFLFSQWSIAYGHNLAYLGDRYKAHELELLNGYIKRYKQLDVLPTIRYYFEHHLEIEQAISILHRTSSNVEFWEELERIVNTPREDLNFDGVVNILDLVIVVNAFGNSIDSDLKFDLNFDGVVNILDLVIVANAFN
ncbi:MAG: dockerin type I domain-containing protein [Candidatus Poribacteria bacterium]|nr:dockerin type I domain-containing protein [Candidatus Poribacteria bacterium]